MAAAISRRKLAIYTAGMVIDGKATLAVKQLAAFLVLSNRMRETDLVVRDIEAELMRRGVVLATVTSARTLTEAVRRRIRTQLAAPTVQLTEVVDPQVIGGICIDIPGSRYDATVRHKLQLLTEMTLS